MIKIEKIIICLTLIIFLCMGVQAKDKDNDQIVIESKLFRGTNQIAGDYPHEVIITSFSTSFFIPETSEKAESQSESAESLKNELNKVFQVKRIDHLISGNMIWDGKKARLSETISLDEFSYPIHFSPKVISKKSVNLKIEMFRVKNTDATRTDKKLEKLLDTEIVVNFDKPIILGFPLNGNTYFLSIFITKKHSAGVLSGKVIEVPSPTRLMMPPSPLYRFNPVYPNECRKSQIEGSVILEVSTDLRGYVRKVRVLKPVHPRLDQAALLALKQWRYESLIIDGERVPAVFVVSVDFKLRGEGSALVHARKSDETDLGKILNKCADYCEKLENIALYFERKEKITEDIFSGRSKGSNVYVYDYRFQKMKNGIAESRILKEENNKRRYTMNAELKTNVFLSERALLEPLNYLSESVQDLYDYELITEEDVFGKSAYVIKAVHEASLGDNPNYGIIWVDKENFSILKIEKKQESLVGYEELKENLKEKGINPVLVATHYYEIEKKGLRFPSRTDFFEGYRGLHIPAHKVVKRSETVIEFYDYRFITLKRM